MRREIAKPPILAVLAVLAAVSCGEGNKPITAFSAEQWTQKRGQPPQTAHIYIAPQKIRIERPTDGAGTAVTVAREDLGVLWTMVPGRRAYRETTLDPARCGPMMPVEQERIIEELGTETVNGFACRKVRVRAAGDLTASASAGSSLVWISQRLPRPLRCEAGDGTVTELRHIVPGAQSDSLFEVPDGYEKTGMMIFTLDTASLAYFDPTATEFTLDNAYFMAWMVGIASQNDESKIRSDLRSRGFTTARLFKTRDLHGIVARHPRFVVLAFRGSTTVQDWINDFKFFQLKSKKTGLPGRVHRGFFKALDSQWSEISKELAGPAASGMPIWITGHSLGGGLSQVAAMRAAVEGMPVAGLYSFASPKVGDREFLRAFDRRCAGRCYRVVNGEDLVPHVAPSEPAEEPFAELLRPANKRYLSLPMKGAFLRTEYSHGGELYAFDESGTFIGRQQYSDQDDVRYWQSMHRAHGRGAWLIMIAENSDVAKKHSLKEYIRLHRQALLGRAQK